MDHKSNKDFENRIKESRFSERMLFLLRNPELGKETVCLRTSSMHINGYKQTSSCWGTTVFILNAMQKFLDAFQHRTIENGRVIEVEAPIITEHSFFLENDSRPGYVDLKHMEWFLKEQCTATPTNALDTIVAISGPVYDGDDCKIFDGLLHTGISLGKINGIDYIIEQSRRGDLFKAEKLETYSTKYESRLSFYTYRQLPYSSSF